MVLSGYKGSKMAGTCKDSLCYKYVESGLTNVEVMVLLSARFFEFLVSLPYISLSLTLKRLKKSTNFTARILNSFLFKDSLSIPLYLQCRPTESQRE